MNRSLSTTLFFVPALLAACGLASASPKTEAPQRPDALPTQHQRLPDDMRQPLERIGLEMRAVKARLANQRSGDDTQRMQLSIVAQLAALLEQARSQCQGGQSSKPSEAGRAGAGNKPAQTAPRNSRQTVRDQKPAAANPEAIRQRMHEAWGNLPQRQREQMLQAPVDGFLPKYELLIEEYFKRLSEENDQSQTR
jgi:hypothetical protein